MSLVPPRMEEGEGTRQEQNGPCLLQEMRNQLQNHTHCPGWLVRGWKATPGLLASAEGPPQPGGSEQGLGWDLAGHTQTLSFLVITGVSIWAVPFPPCHTCFL